MPLLKELSRTSRDSFESDSDSKESRDVRLNSFKSGILRFFDSIDSIFISIRSILRPRVVVDRPDESEIIRKRTNKPNTLRKCCEKFAKSSIDTAITRVDEWTVLWTCPDDWYQHFRRDHVFETFEYRGLISNSWQKRILL